MVKLKKRSRSTRLLIAVSMVQGVLSELDLSMEPCDCCGMNKMNHYGESKSAAVLQGVLNKLHQQIATIDNPNRTKQ